MGQRSQMYIRVNRPDGKYHLVARYFGWNYGERMVSRARHTLEWVKKNTEKLLFFFEQEFFIKLAKIMEVNFDMHDVVISADILGEVRKGDYGPDSIFTGQDNNDGQFILDVHLDYENKSQEDASITFKYAFLDCGSKNPMNAEAYMQWDNGDPEQPWRENQYIKNALEYTEQNIAYIDQNAALMTEEEANEFVTCDYTESI